MNLRKQYKMMFASRKAMDDFNDRLDNIKNLTGDGRGPLMVKAVNLYYYHLLEGQKKIELSE